MAFHIVAAQASVAAAPGAVVRETVGQERLRLSWLLSRAFRSGQTHARRHLTPGSRRVMQAGFALAKACACAAMALLRLASPAGWRRALTRGALHVGVVARLAGVREGQLY